MKMNGTIVLILVAALAVFSGVAWTTEGDLPVCPLTGAPAPVSDAQLDELFLSLKPPPKK